MAAAGSTAGIATAAKLFSIGASESVLHDLWDDEDPDFVKATLGGLLGLIKTPVKVKGGTYFSPNKLTKNSQLVGAQYIINKIINVMGLDFYNQLLQQNQQQDIDASNADRTPGLHLGGGHGTLYEVVSDDGGVYPTNNPDWRPSS